MIAQPGSGSPAKRSQMNEKLNGSPHKASAGPTKYSAPLGCTERQTLAH
jgi:hypothetical protein